MTNVLLLIYWFYVVTVVYGNDFQQHRVNTMTQNAHIEVNKMGVQASSANRLFILVCIEIFKIMEGQSISKGCFLLSHHIRSM